MRSRSWSTPANPYPVENLRLIFTQDVPEKSVIGAALYASDHL